VEKKRGGLPSITNWEKNQQRCGVKAYRQGGKKIFSMKKGALRTGKD